MNSQGLRIMKKNLIKESKNTMYLIQNLLQSYSNKKCSTSIKTDVNQQNNIETSGKVSPHIMLSVNFTRVSQPLHWVAIPSNIAGNMEY